MQGQGEGLSMSRTCCVVESGSEEEEQKRRGQVEKTRERESNHRYKDLAKCEQFKHATYPFAA